MKMCTYHPDQPVLAGSGCGTCRQSFMDRREAEGIVKRAPGFQRHIIAWSIDGEDSERRPVYPLFGSSNDFGGGKFCSEEAIYLFEVAANAASELAANAAAKAATELEEREQRIAFAAVYTKVFGVAFDAALTEINQQDLREEADS